jgi:hypothetical protein
MKLEISATAVKSWFQYHCERKLVYDSMARSSRQAIPIQENLLVSPWADQGNQFEQRVMDELKRLHPGSMLAPLGGDDHLSEQMTLAFLSGKRAERFAHQTVLRETPTLRRLLGLPQEVSLRQAHPDLLEVEEVDGHPVFHVIDVKATQVSTVFHKAQVAFYSLMLRCALQELGLPGEPALVGRIWHMPPPGQAGPWVEQPFPLRGYEAFVIDFFRRTVPELTQRRVGPEHDDTFFHIYFKCEQCPYLPHCTRSISPPAPPGRWDVSAVYGLGHESKRALHGLGIREVEQLARAARLASPSGSVSWALKARGPTLVARARALQDQHLQRLPDRRSWLMPPRVDVAIHLVADRDPMEGNLVTLGCLVTREGRAESTVKVIVRGEDERQALREVLGRVIEILTRVDAWNARREEAQGLHAHLFLYEPSEGRDLQEALGRHLEDPEIRTGLLHLVRMFPPDEVRAVEPEYRGMHHLPATALKSVVEQLYALPVKVTYDLAGVTRALASATPPLTPTYEPARGFAHPFSSRLSIDVARALRSGQREPAQVHRDVEARLVAMNALARWLLADNARAGGGHLLLRKKPFRFQAHFHPLDATDLEILMAHELLENRSARLASLTALARPHEERRHAFQCFARLRLEGSYRDGRHQRLRFFVPPESRQTELSSTTLGLILTDDDPDLRLDPTRWESFRVRIVSDLENGQHLEVEMARDLYDAPEFQRLRRKTREDGWYIDPIHIDYTTARAVQFLRFLAKEG